MKIEGIEFELREEAPPSPYKRKLESVPNPERPQLDQLSEEDLLLWSTPQEEVG